MPTRRCVCTTKAIEAFQKKEILKPILLGITALFLLILGYFLFFSSPTNKQNRGMNEKEEKLCATLSKIDGVGDIVAYVSENESGQTIGAVLVLEGADRLSIRLDVLQAAATALGVEQNAIRIYGMAKE